MKTRTLLAAVMLISGMTASPSARSEEQRDPAELAAALTGVPMPLQDGIKASASQGQPISAKYEVENGALQLSVYTERGKFYEVIVDHSSGKIAKSEEITKADDLQEARDQMAIMAKATDTLAAAADKAAQANRGFRVVSIVPEVKSGRAVAEVRLLNGTSVKTVDEPLD